jgi:hypothetical protein
MFPGRASLLASWAKAGRERRANAAMANNFRPRPKADDGCVPSVFIDARFFLVIFEELHCSAAKALPAAIHVSAAALVLIRFRTAMVCRYSKTL